MENIKEEQKLATNKEFEEKRAAHTKKLTKLSNHVQAEMEYLSATQLLEQAIIDL